MITFIIGTLSDITEDLFPLFEKHHEEIQRFKGNSRLDINWASLRNFEQKGNLSLLWAVKDDEVVGYSLFVISRHFLYDYRVASNVAIYLRQSFREGLTGAKFLLEHDMILRRDKEVKEIKWETRPWYDFGVILKKMGYEHGSNIYTKFLE